MKTTIDKCSSLIPLRTISLHSRKARVSEGPPDLLFPLFWDLGRFLCTCVIDGKILSELVRLNGFDDLGVTNIVHKAKIVGHLRRIAEESAGAASTASGISADAPSSAGSKRLRKSMMKCLCLFCFACLIARSVCLFDYLFVFVRSGLF